MKTIKGIIPPMITPLKGVYFVSLLLLILYVRKFKNYMC